jgi:hypothetical protein
VGSKDAGTNPAPQINGGLLDPSTFPAYLRSQSTAPSDGPVVDAQKPQITGPLDSDVHAEVLQDIQDAQSQLPPISLDRAAAIISGPLRTDANLDAFQKFMNAQAGLPPVQPHPETWSVNGQPYQAISASTYNPARSTHVTAAPSPEDSAAASAGVAQLEVPLGTEERTGFIAHSPSRIVVRQGKPGGDDSVDTMSFKVPAGSPVIHAHIDLRRPEMSAGISTYETPPGFVDKSQANDGFGDTQSLGFRQPVATGTIFNGQVGWHILDDGQLKFLYPAGSMPPEQISDMQRNLNDEQGKFVRKK